MGNAAGIHRARQERRLSDRPRGFISRNAGINESNPVAKGQFLGQLGGQLLAGEQLNIFWHAQLFQHFNGQHTDGIIPPQGISIANNQCFQDIRLFPAPF